MLLTSVSVDYGIRGNSLLAAMKDGDSVNQAAMERIKFTFPKVFSVVCFSHTLDNVGNHFQIPTLREFGNLWIRMFSHSHKAKLSWQEQTGRKPVLLQDLVVVQVGSISTIAGAA